MAGEPSMPLAQPAPVPGIIFALDETPLFAAGDQIRISVRFPVGHYRVPNLHPRKSGRGRAGDRTARAQQRRGRLRAKRRIEGYYYRVAIPLTSLWPDYAGAPEDGLRIEVFETWLERA